MTPLLADAGCVLAPWRASHDAPTVAWLGEPALREDFGITTAVTLEGHRRWRAARPELIAWAIESDDRHVGNLLLDPCPRHASAYLQIYLGEPAARGRGLGRRAMRLALDAAFGPLSLHRIWLHTRPGNVRAESLYLGLGFAREGLEREAIRRGQAFEDQWRWSLLAPEWRSEA